MKKTRKFYVYLAINITLLLLFIFSICSLLYPNEIYLLFGQHLENISYLNYFVKMLKSSYALLIIVFLFLCIHIYQYKFDKKYKHSQISFELNNKSFKCDNINRDEFEQTTIVSGKIKNIANRHFDYIKIQLVLLKNKQIIGAKEYFIKEIEANEENDWILWFDSIDFDSVKIKISTKSD